MVADGSKQRSYEGYEKSDWSPPTARTDSIIMTRVVDAHERRNIALKILKNQMSPSSGGAYGTEYAETVVLP